LIREDIWKEEWYLLGCYAVKTSNLTYGNKFMCSDLLCLPSGRNRVIDSYESQLICLSNHNSSSLNEGERHKLATAAAGETATSEFRYIGFHAPSIWLLSFSTPIPVAKLALHASVGSPLPCKFFRKSLSLLTSLPPFRITYSMFLSSATQMPIPHSEADTILLSLLQEIFVPRYIFPWSPCGKAIMWVPFKERSWEGLQSKWDYLRNYQPVHTKRSPSDLIASVKTTKMQRYPLNKP
jgi:hypothetical protein